MPWKTVSGTFTTSSGRASTTGTSVAIASQGGTLGYAGTRLRFKFSLASLEHAVSAAFNSDVQGLNGLGVRVSGGTGALSVSEKGRLLGSVELGALEVDTDYYVNLGITGTEGRAELSTINFAGVPGSVAVGGLSVDGLAQDTTGTFASMALEGTGTTLDLLSVARCGVAAPNYTALLVDNFDRADGTTLGGPQIPTAATWTRTSETYPIEIGSNTLVVSGPTGVRTQTEHYQNRGLRIRATTKFGDQGWLVISYNELNSGEASNGFDLWRENDTTVFVEYRRSEDWSRAPFTLDFDTFYYIQFDVDADVGVVTVRSTGYDGPILFAFFAGGFSEAPPAQTDVVLSNTGASNASLTIDELRIDRYAP